MTSEEIKIFNNGERLIPFVTHNEKERIRHKKSYLFFKKLIEQDRANKPITILDLGCGVGWGSKLLAEINYSHITGIDIDKQTIKYAYKHYNYPNIKYIISDIKHYTKIMPFYDYIVSRGVIEHIKNGLELIKQLKFNKKIIFDVPYNEKKGNPHHKLLRITEKDLAIGQIYYENEEGLISETKDFTPNMIMCIINKGSNI